MLVRPQKGKVNEIMRTVQDIFDRYQAIRGRLPETAFPGRTKDIRSLMDIAAPADDLSDIPGKTVRLGDEHALYDHAEGFLFLSSEGWSQAQQAVLRQTLSDAPRPVVIANADLAAPREAGFSLEPGFFGHLLLDEIGGDIRFFGKPYADVYTRVETSLSHLVPNRIAMVGDTLHTDIIGGAARGWQTVLVTQDGMFAGHDAREYCVASGIEPDWCVKRI